MNVPGLPSRYRGALLGLAAGDALGTTLEFTTPGSFAPITDLVGGGPFRLRAGQWTDDTSMALCLAESLVECAGFDPLDQLRRYVRWYREGYLSSTGRCFDIGSTTRAALDRFERTGEPWCGPTADNTAGNGSLMRLAPVPLFFAGDVRTATARAADSSRTTHGARAAVDACRYYAALIAAAVNGAPKHALLAPPADAPFAPFADAPFAPPADAPFAPPASRGARGAGEPLHPEVADVAAGSFLRKHPPEIRGSGYAVHSLEAALWAFAHTDDFASGALAAVNLGDDADTTGAVYGQLAGAHYGEDAIPAEWRAKLALRERIEALAEALLAARLRVERAG